MLDSALRPVKDRLLAPLIGTRLGRVSPTLISAIGLVLTLAAAVAAWQQLTVIAVALWLAGRLADGIDGLVARASGRATDVGGLLDFVFDTIGYASIPLGLAFGLDTRTLWIATAVVLASFYLNAVSLGYVSALIEKRDQHGSSATSVVLPRGLVEGSETMVFFTAALALPDASPIIWSVMAAAVIVTAIERVRWATRSLS